MRQHSISYYCVIFIILFAVLALFLLHNALELESDLEIESKKLKSETIELSVAHATIDKQLKNNVQ